MLWFFFLLILWGRSLHRFSKRWQYILYCYRTSGAKFVARTPCLLTQTAYYELMNLICNQTWSPQIVLALRLPEVTAGYYFNPLTTARASSSILTGPGRQSNGPEFWLKLFLETRWSPASIEFLLDLPECLEPKLWPKNPILPQIQKMHESPTGGYSSSL